MLLFLTLHLLPSIIIVLKYFLSMYVYRISILIIDFYSNIITLHIAVLYTRVCSRSKSCVTTRVIGASKFDSSDVSRASVLVQNEQNSQFLVYYNMFLFLPRRFNFVTLLVCLCVCLLLYAICIVVCV